jgi:hypothetical protein
VKVHVPLAGSSLLGNVATGVDPKRSGGRDRASPGSGSLPKREWDQANGHKQVKGASKEMRFNVWVNLFCHFDLIVFLILFSSNLRE